MALMLALLLALTAMVWGLILAYLRAATRTFDRQLNRTFWPLWDAARRRDDDPLERNR